MNSPTLNLINAHASVRRYKPDPLPEHLVETIVLAGQNKITPEDFVQILNAKDRTQAGPTAPAHGLFLKRVNYS